MFKKLALVAALTLSGICVADAQTPLPLCPSQLGSCLASHISANATTVIKSGSGVLHTVSINTLGASANTLTLYDNTAASGTVIAVIDTTSQTTSRVFDISFSTGLTAVTATGTAADITISYR